MLIFATICSIGLMFKSSIVINGECEVRYCCRLTRSVWFMLSGSVAMR